MTGLCSKIDSWKNKNIFHIDGDLGGNCFHVNDLRNLQNSKMYCFLGVFVPTTECLLRLSDKTCAITFTMLYILFSSVSPLKRKCISTKHILRLFESFKNGKGEKMANMRQQSKGREKERDILGDTPPQFWLLSRRVVDIPPCGSFPDLFLANSPPPPPWLISCLILWLMTRPAVDVAPCGWFHAFLTAP